MRVTSRPAEAHDLAVVEDLYRRLEDEMTGLHPMWPLEDGLAEPASESLRVAFEDPASHLVIGEIDGVPFGFLLARVEAMLPQAGGDLLGSIRLIFTDLQAREVGLAESMRDLAMTDMRAKGITKFDAHVLPGHRLAKNFFEAGGFSARHIIMHHDDKPIERPGRDPRRF